MSIKLLYAILISFTVASAVPFDLHAEEEAASEEEAAPAVDPKVQAEQDEELDFIRALIDCNLPDFAAPVIAAARKQWPELNARLEVLEQEGELRLGNFDKVKSIIAKKTKGSPEYWALEVSLADAYYSRGKNKECADIYDAFFKAVPKPTKELQSFWINASYKWAQMLVAQKRFDDATKIYDTMVAQKIDEKIWCAVAAEDTELLIRLAAETDPVKGKAKREAYLKRASATVKKLLWKRDLIIWFGRAIAFKAHIEVLRGNLEKAQQLVNDYMADLSDIHSQLLDQDPDGSKGVLRLSPMPQCRYLLADILWNVVMEESKKPNPDKEKILAALLGAKVAGGKRNGSGAYNHAIAVYVKYPESPWAASAGELVDKICDYIKDNFGKDLRAATKIPADQMKKVRQMQFKNAAAAYAEGDYKSAVDQYLDLLRQFPEVDESVKAVTTLADAYFNLWKQARDEVRTAKDDKTKAEKEEDVLWYRLHTDAVEGYLATRFAGLKKPELVKMAGEQVLRFAGMEYAAGNLAGSKLLYDTYFDTYRTHYLAASTAKSLAGLAWTKEDWQTAAHYYQTIANIYSNSTVYVDALKVLPECYRKMNDVTNQIFWLKRYANEAKRPYDRALSNLQLANIQQKEGFEHFKKADDGDDSAKAAAVQNVVNAMLALRKVASDCDAATKDSLATEQEKEQMRAYRGLAMFLEGDCWQRLNFPIKTFTVDNFRKFAIEAYEKYLKDYPEGKYSTNAYMKISTAYTALKDGEKASEALSRLEKKFPDSEEAKNSKPRLAKTLIEMGLRNEGVEKYKEMINTTGGKYTARQYVAAGDALLDARAWDVAITAYAKAKELAQKDEKASHYVALATLGNAKAFKGANRLAESHDALDNFVNDEKFSKTTLVKDAYNMLVDVAMEEGRRAGDDDQRRKYFNQAIGAIKKLRVYYKNDPIKQFELNIQANEVLIERMNAEEQRGLREQADETRRLAVAGLRADVIAHEPNEEHPASEIPAAELALLERLYGDMLPLMARLGKDFAADVVKYGETYKQLFPDGKHKTQVQNAVNGALAESNGAEAAPETKPVEAAAGEKAPAAEETKPADGTKPADEAAKPEAAAADSTTETKAE